VFLQIVIFYAICSLFYDLFWISEVSRAPLGGLHVASPLDLNYVEGLEDLLGEYLDSRGESRTGYPIGSTPPRNPGTQVGPPGPRNLVLYRRVFSGYLGGTHPVFRESVGSPMGSRRSRVGSRWS